MTAESSHEMTAAEFSTWEARQLLRYDLVEVYPMRRPEMALALAPTRIRRPADIAGTTLRTDDAGRWMGMPQADLDGLSPSDLAAHDGDSRRLAFKVLIPEVLRRTSTYG